MFQKSLLSIYLFLYYHYFISLFLFCYVLFCFVSFIYLFFIFWEGGGGGFVVELNKFRANKCKQSKGKESDPTSSLSKVL